MPKLAVSSITKIRAELAPFPLNIRECSDFHDGLSSCHRFDVKHRVY